MQFTTNLLLLNIIIFVFGVAVLVKGSDWFVDAAAALARSFGVPELVIGLTLVSIGTSLPELASSLCASFYGESNFIIGNIVGSNTANIALILGAGLTLGGSIGFARQVIWRDMFFLLLLGTGLMAWYYFGVDAPGDAGYGFGRIGGIILLVLCAVYSLLLCRSGEASSEAPESEDNPVAMSRVRACGLIVLALVMITAGAKCMVDTVVWSAVKLGISELMISLTIVAVGTSLPELAVTVSGILKKREDIALGNIIGSGIYNIVLIIGACSVVSPLTGNGKDSIDSMIIMNGTAFLLWIFLLTARKLKLYRWQGIIFLALYAAFIVWSILCVK
jgi:cation:H+ antiporter